MFYGQPRFFKVVKTNHQIDNKPKEISQRCECSVKKNPFIAKSFKYYYWVGELVG